MVETPPRQHSSRHRRTASILAQRAISNISRDRRQERRRIARGRRIRAKAAVLQDMKIFFGLPVTPRRPRLLRQPRPQQEGQEVIDLSSSAESFPQPAPPQIVLDLDSSLESLPNIDPRPQFQLPVEPLVDLGCMDVTQELIPPLRHQTFREACVLLQ